MAFRKKLKTGILGILVSGLLSLGPLIVTTASAEDTQPRGVSEDASMVPLDEIEKPVIEIRNQTADLFNRERTKTLWHRNGGPKQDQSDAW